MCWLRGGSPLLSGAAGDAATDQATPARVQLGPIGLRPALILREIGYDSNVFNENDRRAGGLHRHVRRPRSTSASRLAQIRCATSTLLRVPLFQGVRRASAARTAGIEGRVDFLLGRLRPHLLGGVSNSHERPSAEIDARALRQQTTVGFGVAAAALSRTTLNVGYRRNGTDYADDEAFRGVDLADELNGAAALGDLRRRLRALAADHASSVHGEELRERFTLSPDRDADSHRYGVTALLIRWP